MTIARDSEGGLHAFDDTCTHANVSLSEGEVDGCAIECWLHGSRFDLRTGARSEGAAGVLSEPREVTAPIGLVCTHGKRDQCCAVRGRPVVAGLESRLGDRLSSLDQDSAVWECSHTGGHRFAPVLLLPGTGYTYGPAETDLAVRIVEAELDGRVVTETAFTRLTGRSPQVDDHGMRQRGGEHDAARLRQR